MTVRILKGDCRDVLREMEPESVHCVVTSPPYWGLRDYGVAGQIGLEGSFAGYVEIMRNVFAQVWRVLRKDGTLWLNLGDSYAGGGRGGGSEDCKQRTNVGSLIPAPKWTEAFRPGNPEKNGGASNRDGLGPVAGLKPKDLCGLPWRVAFALQADGWYLRSDIIWSKPNPMPESVTDRPTKAHEYIFLLSKSERYFYDADAVREPHSEASLERYEHGFNREKVSGTGFVMADAYKTVHGNPAGRNRRSVWEIATAPFSEAHFATFPPQLIEPCIMAGCPKGGTVLDPFGGAGTTGLVADRLERSAILIELNPEYADMAERRIRSDAGMFAQVAAE